MSFPGLTSLSLSAWYVDLGESVKIDVQTLPWMNRTVIPEVIDSRSHWWPELEFRSVCWRMVCLSTQMTPVVFEQILLFFAPKGPLACSVHSTQIRIKIYNNLSSGKLS